MQVKAVIYIDVPEWQIGEDVTVYFPDTMMKVCKCELLKEQEAVEPITTITYNGFRYDYCGACNRLLPVAQDFEKAKFCPHCGRPVRWE